MLFHCIPKLKENDTSFDFTMRSVLVAQKGLVSAVEDNTIFCMETVKQEKSKQIRYTKNQDFTDKEAAEFLKKNIKIDPDTFIYPDLINTFTL